uniref:Uncharacterized protein n=1 Tax=Panagrolaimus sp. ES5 TaxID=591445 RepID=A0AC34GW21_9BILA
MYIRMLLEVYTLFCELTILLDKKCMENKKKEEVRKKDKKNKDFLSNKSVSPGVAQKFDRKLNSLSHLFFKSVNVL